MAEIIRKSWQGYNYVFDELADSRTKSWFLIAKPYEGILLLGLYLMIVFKWGPQWMKNRPAYNIEKLLIVYNAFQVIACSYIFYNGLILGWARDYQWFCEPVDYSNDERALRIATVVYYYFWLKVIDLLDTVFFLLRKKFNQVSFLHVYHHTGMVMLVWGTTTYFAGGHGTFIGVLNSFVHIVMYGYYLLTVAVPSLKGSLWWKKYITQLQIIQFFWFVIHMGAIVFMPNCAFPRWTAAVFLPQNIFMLVLFVDFYIKEYIKKPKALALQESNGVKNTGSIKNGSRNSGSTKNGSTKNGSNNTVSETNGTNKTHVN
ncbi:elongation of very long chain fatty acids protein 7-like [Achroia grisella]|uniref:elongation of very long chain fatty acids protein 7-like n=1 Tax=Achroia grisella TaxID=688607 RepID=UPI0027D34ECC|nr:elongation of very long chain fatty acids protein 7-like [Achroia grisella]